MLGVSINIFVPLGEIGFFLLVEVPPHPVFGHHRDSRRSGRDPAPVSGKFSSFNRITPDVGPTYPCLSVDQNAGNRVVQYRRFRKSPTKQ